MDSWWGPEWHAGHEAKIKAQLVTLYSSRFACSNRNLVRLLRQDPEMNPCQSHFNFNWLSKWGQRPEIQVKVDCTCGEVFRRFYAILDSDGQVISDTEAPWLIPLCRLKKRRGLAG